MTNPYLEQIEQALYGYLPQGDYKEQKLLDAMRYSLEAGGKRVRPMLVTAFCVLCGGGVEKAPRQALKSQGFRRGYRAFGRRRAANACF